MDDKNNIKEIIKKYIIIDDEISEVNKKLKVLRKSKNDLEENIKEYMIDNDMSKVDLRNGSIRVYKTKPTKKINKQLIMDVLLDKINNDDKVNDIIDELYNNEHNDEIVKLERSKKN